MAACVLAIMAAFEHLGFSGVVARTMRLTTFSFARIFFALETNDERESVFRRELLENHPLLKMCGLSLVTTFLIIALGFTNQIFSTTLLDLTEWWRCIAAGSVMLWGSRG